MTGRINWNNHNRKGKVTNLNTDQAIRLHSAKRFETKPPTVYRSFKTKTPDNVKRSPAPMQVVATNGSVLSRRKNIPITLPSFKCLENQED